MGLMKWKKKDFIDKKVGIPKDISKLPIKYMKVYMKMKSLKLTNIKNENQSIYIFI